MPAAEPAVRNIPSLRAPYAPADEAIAAGVAGERRAAAGGRSAHRRPRDASRRSDPRALGRPRRGRGFPARLRALDQGGPRADGAGGGAAARARRRDRRPPDRGQARRPATGRITRRSSGALLVSASAWTLGITARVIHPGETPEGIVEALVKRLGLPAVRAATRQAMRLLGSHFVLGRDHRRRARARRRAPRVSLFLRHAGRGRAHRRRCRALFRVLRRTPSAKSASTPATTRCRAGPGISVKLSALHPRYEPLSRERVLRELTPRAARAGAARQGARPQFHRRRRGGRPARAVARRSSARCCAIPRSPAGTASASPCRPIRSARRAVIDWIAELARRARPPPDGAPGQGRLLGHRDQARAGARARRLSGVHPQGDDRPLLPRLRAQAAGGAAAALSAIRHPQCADRRERDRGRRRRRGLRIPAPARHGRGALRARCSREYPALACRVYAPVGGHADLLAYLVRRLLENGANSSFVSVAADPAVPIARDLAAPAELDRRRRGTRAIRISRCRAICSCRSARIRAGVEFGDRAALAQLLTELALRGAGRLRAAGRWRRVAGAARDVMSPIDAETIGTVREGDAAIVAAAMAAAQAGFAGLGRDAGRAARAARSSAPAT